MSEERIEMWVNVYSDDVATAHHLTKDAADQMAGPGRTRRAHLKEIRDGERITGEPELPVPGVVTNGCGESRTISNVNRYAKHVRVEGHQEYADGKGHTFSCSLEEHNAWLAKRPRRKVMVTKTHESFDIIRPNDHIVIGTGFSSFCDAERARERCHGNPDSLVVCKAVRTYEVEEDEAS